MVFTDAQVMDGDARPAGYTLWEKLPLKRDERWRLQSDRAIDELLQGSIVTGATMAFRGRFKELGLPIPDDLPIIHDAWIAILVAAISEVFPLAVPLIRYRQHGRQKIGAKERRSEGGGVRKAMRRANSYDASIEIAMRVNKRLSERRSVFPCDEAQARLASRQAHLEMRAQLPEHALSRLARVISELVTRSYHAYSRGLLSAAKDLLYLSKETSHA